jgi:hypothetical protein
MTKSGSNGGFSDKHGPGAVIDPEAKQAVTQYARKGELPCAVAFAAAARYGCPPGEIGKAVDLMGLRLTKCQLGLYGYGQKKKIVFPETPEPALAAAISKACANGRISCETIWDIARRMKMRKLGVSKACEAMGIKIIHCQLGAF